MYSVLSCCSRSQSHKIPPSPPHKATRRGWSYIVCLWAYERGKLIPTSQSSYQSTDRCFEPTEGSWNPESNPKFTFDYSFVCVCVCVLRILHWRSRSDPAAARLCSLPFHSPYKCQFKTCVGHNWHIMKRWHSDCTAFIKAIPSFHSPGSFSF